MLALVGLALCACSDSGGGAPTLTSIAITPPAPSVAAGFSQPLTATGTYSDMSTVDLTAYVVWSSEDAAMAKVDVSGQTAGRVDALSTGSVLITAIDPDTGISATTTVTVTPAVLVSVDVTPPAPSVAAGQVQQFTATGTFSDSTTQDLTSSVTWSSAAPATVTVSNDLGTEGLATTLASGSTTVTATHVDSGLKGSATLTVTAALLVSIAVTPPTPSVALGFTQQFTATGTFSDMTTQDLTTSVAWESSSTAIASVSNSAGSVGLATTSGMGSATITATDPTTGVTASTTLTVTSAALVWISVTPALPSVALGYTQQFTATGLFSDGSIQDLTTSVTWSSSDEPTASISNAAGTRGLATSAGTGTTTITATDPGTSITGATDLTVTPAVLVSIDVTPALHSLALGYEQQFTATGTFSDMTTQDMTTAVTWSSSNTAVATISNAVGTEGLCSTVAIGSTDIAATEPGTGIAGSTTFTVTPAVLVSVAVTPTTPSVALGYEVPFAATGTFSDMTTQDLTAAVTWTSSEPTAATVSNAAGSEGLASTVATGSTDITATEPGTGLSGSTTLTVEPAVLVSLEVDPIAASLPLGYDQQFTATGTYSDSTTTDLTSAVTWTSSSTSTAVVSNAAGSEGLATSVATGSMTITALDPSTGISAATTFVVTQAVLVSIDVTPTAPSVALGFDQPFTATGTYSDSTTADLTTAVTWSSSDTGVAVISSAAGSEGLATSVATGSTTITATEPGSAVSGSTGLTITPAVLVTIDVTPASPSVALGYDQQFTATGTYSDSTTTDLTSAVTWTSSNTGTAVISNAAGSEGLATTMAAGTTTIFATEPGSGTVGSTVLTVTAAVLTSITVQPPSPSLPVGYNQQFTAIGTFSDASSQDLTTSVTWGSSSTATATIRNAAGSEGLATSLAVGTTTIAAVDPGTGITGTTVLTATPPVLVSITVTPADPSVALGREQQLTATGTFSDASTLDMTSSVTWGSSNTAVATVSNVAGTRGLASSTGTGTTTVTAIDPVSALSGSTTLTVTSAVLVSIAVAPTAPTVPLGLTRQFTATGTFSDSSQQDVTASVTWTSSDLAVATVSNSGGSEGLATSTGQGATTITATHAGSGSTASTTLTVGDPIVFGAAGTVTAPSGQLTMAVPTPTGTQAGDVLLAAITVRPSSATITAPSGWTLIRRSDNTPPNASSLLIYSRVATASEPPSHSWSFSTSQGSAGCMLSFQGVDTSTIIDVEDGHETLSSLSHSTPSVVTTTPNTMIVTFHTITSSVTWTPPAGMNEVVDIASDDVHNGGVSLLACWEFQPVAGATGVRTAVASNNAGTGNACILALRD